MSNRIESPSYSFRSGGSLPNLPELPSITQIKVKRREALYDFPEALCSRQALVNKVLPIGLNLDKLNRKGHHHADDEVAAWIQAERTRADNLAQKKWSNKFQQWKEEFLLKGPASLEDPAATNTPSDAIPGVIEAAECRTHDRLSGELGRLGEELGRLNEELQKEHSLKSALERRLHEMIVERDGWKMRAIRSQESVQKAIRKKQGVTEQISEMSQLLKKISTVHANAFPPNRPTPVVEPEEDNSRKARIEGLRRRAKVNLQSSALDDSLRQNLSEHRINATTDLANAALDGRHTIENSDVKLELKVVEGSKARTSSTPFQETMESNASLLAEALMEGHVQSVLCQQDLRCKRLMSMGG